MATITTKQQAYNILAFDLVVGKVESALNLFENEDRLARLFYENKKNLQNHVDEYVELSLKCLEVFAKKKLKFKLPKIVINDFVIEKYKTFFTAILKMLKSYSV